MKQSMFAVFVIAALGLGGACGKGSADPVATMKSYRDQMCACAKSGAPGNCLPKINVAEKRWEEGLKDGAMTKAQEAQAETLKDEFTACRDTANGR